MKIRLAAIAIFLAGAAPASADNNGVWTDKEVKKLCHFRAGDSANAPAAYERCMERRALSVGKPKKPGESAELDRADKKLDEKIAARAAKKTASETTEETK